MANNFLLASWGGPGNLAPLLTAARRLRRSGHAVRVIADADLREEVEVAGFDFAPWRRAPAYSSFGNAALLSDPSDPRSFLDLLFGTAAAYAADTREALDAAPTDALLALDLLLGSALAAEAADMPCALLAPHVSIRPLPGVPPVGSGLKPARTRERQMEVELATSRFAGVMNEQLPVLNKARATQGLAPLAHVFDQYDRADRMLLAISSAFDFLPHYLPNNLRYVGPLLDPPGWSRPWKAPWPAGSDRPRVLVSFSTTVQDQAAALQRVFNALGGMPIDAVATTGPALVGQPLHAPKNVTLLHSAPHDAVMQEVSLVVTHGGHGTVCRALVHGLPLLVMPMGRDQNDNALRVEAHGAGLSLPPTASEAEIAAALHRLVAEPRFRLAAAQLAEAIAGDVDSDGLVREMEMLAMARRSQAPMRRRRLARM